MQLVSFVRWNMGAKKIYFMLVAFINLRWCSFSLTFWLLFLSCSSHSTVKKLISFRSIIMTTMYRIVWSLWTRSVFIYLFTIYRLSFNDCPLSFLFFMYKKYFNSYIRGCVIWLDIHINIKSLSILFIELCIGVDLYCTRIKFGSHWIFLFFSFFTKIINNSRKSMKNSHIGW